MKKSISKEEQVIKEQRETISKLNKQKEDLVIQNDIISYKLDYLQTVANFAYDWELWIKPNKEIHYCSPSCQDLTGFSCNEIQQTPNIWAQIIYPTDLVAFHNYLDETLSFTILNQVFEFRILTRTKQIRWGEINSRAIYDDMGKFLGIRASIRDITRLKTALGHIKYLTENSDFEQKVKDRYKDELESTERELISTLLLVSNKNALISYIKKKLQGILPSVNKDERGIINDILQKIIGSSIVTGEWQTFKTHFEKMHPGFIDRLASQFPQLTQKDLTLASYLRLNLSSKEIAGLLNITSASVEISRVRLRKKLRLEKKARLTTYIRNM